MNFIFKKEHYIFCMYFKPTNLNLKYQMSTMKLKGSHANVCLYSAIELQVN